MKCPKCGYEPVPEEACYCPHCGAALAAPSPEQACIQAVQDIAQMKGGKANVIDLKGVRGPVNITGPVTQNVGAGPAEPPKKAILSSYLQQVQVVGTASADASPELQRLWGIPFLAHRGAESQPQDLDQAVVQMLSEARQRGSIERLVLLGNAGAGKTPALKYWLRSHAAKLRLQSHVDDEVAAAGSQPTESNTQERLPIPLFVALASLQSNQGLEILLRDSFNAGLAQAGDKPITLDEMTALLNTEVCLILLDGLEDLVSRPRRGGLQTLAHFMESYPQHRYVISCRSSSYGQQLGRLDRLYLAPLSDDQLIEVLGKQRYGRLNPVSLRLVRDRSVLKDILLLGLSLDLLQSKGRVLQEVIRRQLEDDRDKYACHHLTPEAAHGLLERLAISMWCDHTDQYDDRRLMETITVYREEWHEPHQWREGADALLETGLLTHDQGRWSFADRNYSAYFAAAALVREPARLAPILEQISDLWWRDVFEILVGLTPQPEALLLDLLDRDALMAASCYEFAGETAGQAVGNALVDALVEQMGREEASRRKFIVERLSGSPLPRAVEPLLETLYGDWSSMVVMAAAKALSRQMQDKQRRCIIEQTKRRILHADPGCSTPLTTMLGWTARPAKADSVPRLQDTLFDPGQPDRVRGVAAICLGLVGTPQARDALIKLMFDPNADEFVAWCGIEALAEIGGPEVHDAAEPLFAEHIYRTHRWACHRARGVYLLGWVNRAGDETLLQKALRDSNPLVRGYAADAAARLDLKHARQDIEQLLTREDEPFVVRKAAEALGQIGTPDSLPVLERHLREGQARARHAVRQAIAEIKVRHALFAD
jgi:HEAT repeat protein